MAQQDDNKNDVTGHIHVVATFEVVSTDKLNDFYTIMKPVVVLTNKEKGCIKYDIHPDNKNKLLFQLIEEWESQQDLDAHLKASHIKPLFSDKFKEIASASASFCNKEIFDLNQTLICTKVPSTNLFIYDNGPKQISTDDIFLNKKVVVFAIPGAYTPTCQMKHAPTYKEQYNEFINIGVDKVYCLAVNDIFVLNAFNKSVGSDGKIGVLSDWNASFCKQLGNKTIDASAIGLGVRASRFSFYAENGVIKQFFEEPDPSKMTITDAKTILDAIKLCKSYGL